MNWSNVFTIYRKELRDALRDRRTLISTIVIPTVVMPVLMFGFAKLAVTLATKARAEIPQVMVIGGADSPGIRSDLRVSPKLHVVPLTPDWKQKISDKQIRAAVEVPAGFEAGLKAGAAPEVKIFFYQGEMKSQFAADELDRYFRELRQRTVAARIGEHGLPPNIVRIFEVKQQNVAPPEKIGGAIFGGVVTYLVILLCFTGAMYPAIDLTAGEKERGTMETLLCSPVGRPEIVGGKFLLVLTGSLSAMFFSLTSMAVSFGLLMSSGLAHAQPGGAGAPVGHAVLPTVDPFGILGVLLMVLPLAVLFSAVIFSIALLAKSYKEAQSYVTPLVFVIILPAVMAMMPGIDLNAPLAFVPILNLSLVSKEMLSGVWHWQYIALIFLSTCVYAGIALGFAARMFEREDVIFRT